MAFVNGWINRWRLCCHLGVALSGRLGVRDFRPNVCQKRRKICIEFQVNTFTDGYQSSPQVTALKGGGFVATWGSPNLDADNSNSFAQLYDASGAKVEAEFQVNTFSIDWQFVSSASTLKGGGFVAAWKSFDQDGSGYGIYGQRFDAAGARVGGEFHVSTEVTNDQTHTSIAALAGGGFVVTWNSDGQDGDTYGIYVQQFAAQLFGTAADDMVSDTIGANWMDGMTGDDVLKGFGGNDKMFGGAGSDTLLGGKGRDKLKGGAGNDVLDGGKGNDKLIGGAGRDKFVFKKGVGKDTITDFQDDIDTLKLQVDIWGGGLTKQQVVNKYAAVVDGDIVFDFGKEELTLKGFTDLAELKDDISFI